MRDAVDLDEQVGVLQRRDRAVKRPPKLNRRSCSVSSLDGRLDADAVDFDEEAARAGLADLEA